MRLFLALFLFLILPLAVNAEDNKLSKEIIIESPEDFADTPWAKWKIPAGTKLITRKTASGKELHSLEFAGGVSISELENGESLNMDNSGQGAILCAWGIYSAIKATLDECHPEETKLRENIDLAIGKLKNFIIANSLSPVTNNELENALQKERNKLAGRCNGESEKMVHRLKSNQSEFLENFQTSIDESLSIPRPPVWNPCL